jgi:hypothetical protein
MLSQLGAESMQRPPEGGRRPPLSGLLAFPKFSAEWQICDLSSIRGLFVEPWAGGAQLSTVFVSNVKARRLTSLLARSTKAFSSLGKQSRGSIPYTYHLGTPH